MLSQLLAVLITGVSSAAGGGVEAKAKAPEQVVFVCEHGSVKSLIAMQLFNRAAAERGLPVRAVSRGLTPDAAVPNAIAAHLAEDGLAPGGFVPKAFSKADLAGASRVIAIGVDPASVTKGSKVPIESWDDIPAASENYAASRDALRQRIELLLARTGSSSKRPPSPPSGGPGM
jgi:protein-tyrosine-phosphatase